MGERLDKFCFLLHPWVNYLQSFAKSDFISIIIYYIYTWLIVIKLLHI